MRSKVLVRIDRLLVKPVPVAVKMMPDAEMEAPYDGTKKMILVDDVDNRQGAQTLVVWAFSNFVENLRTTISKKSIIIL